MSIKMNKKTSDYYHHFIANNTNLYHYRHTRAIIDIITVNTYKSVQRGLYRISLGYSKSLDSRKTKEKNNKKQNKTSKQTKTKQKRIRIITFGHVEYQ